MDYNYGLSQPGEFKDLVLENLYSISKNAAQLFDNTYRTHTIMFAEDLGHCFSLLQKGLNTQEVLDNVCQWEAAAVLWEGANSLIGAYQSLREGFGAESALIVRYTTEIQALGIAIWSSEDHFKKFTDGKLSGNQCIGMAKKIFPEIGSHYGVLCKLIHPSNMSTLNYLHKDPDGNIELLIGAGLPDKSPRLVRGAMVRLTLALLEFQAATLHAVIELILFDHCPKHHYWKKSGPKTYEKSFSKETQTKWTERVATIEKVLAEWS